jgi:uncharacterized membrane protein (UPF0127 family)
MKNFIKNFGIGLAVFALFAVLGGVYNFLIPKKPSALKKVQIGEQLFAVEIADSPVERMKGLSGRANLPENQGMLFLFESPGNYGFWMMGMYIPIDIVWIRGNQIIGLEKNISSSSSLNYYPPEPVDKVLEINAGLSDKLGIKAGDSILLE